ncbi:MAG: tRNA (N(6)-L-threonylcarbamoyladenosine(37)-C(2))-methylthiotransferase MtaB [Leptospirales bacterium]
MSPISGARQPNPRPSLEPEPVSGSKTAPLNINQTKKIYYFHFGCRVNRLETLNMENNSSLSNSTLTSFETSGSIEEAAYVVINTCTVTNRADVKNRGAIRRVQKLNPHAKIIVTGCYATTDRQEIENMDGVYLVVSNAEKNSIPDLIAAIETNEIDPSAIPTTTESEPAKANRNQETIFKSYPQSLEKFSRAYLKIQDGCDKRCSYCKIPMARGKGISRNFRSIESEVKALGKTGFAEIILTGINIGRYKTTGAADKVENFSWLLHKLVTLPGHYYYRISSLEPESLTPEIIELAGHKKIAPFFHIPLQSASQRILKLMNRKYNPELVMQKFEALRKIRPDVHIGTDLIVGFPGETEDDFLQTLAFVKNANFANIHIFPWSRRSQTSLDRKIDNGELQMVHGSIIRERVKRLKTAADISAQNYIQKTAGNVYRAIIETNNNETAQVTTENYLKCRLPVSTNLQKGQMVNILYDTELVGEIVTR